MKLLLAWLKQALGLWQVSNRHELARYLELQLLLCTHGLATLDKLPLNTRVSQSHSVCKKRACFVRLPVVPCPVTPVGPCGPVLPAPLLTPYKRATWPAESKCQLAHVLPGVTAVRREATLRARQPCGTCKAAQCYV